MSTKKTLWGIIGTGRIAKTFAQALQGCADAQLYAVASRTQKKADEFAVQFGIEKSYGSYEALAADENIDIVYIATPMASHCPFVKSANQKDKMIYTYHRLFTGFGLNVTA